MHNYKLVILDEIQRAPELFMILRGVIDGNKQAGYKNCQFLFLGLASANLLRQSSESLAGRVRYIEMSGLNALEIATKKEDMSRLWFRGGFPDSYLSDDDTPARLSGGSDQKLPRARYSSNGFSGSNSKIA
jgi:uncharacterized protein